VIAKEEILEIIDMNIKDSNIFCVGVSIGSSGLIKVYIDKNVGVTISDCSNLHSQIINELGTKADDIELQVSSPGASASLKVLKQYLKNIGKELEVLMDDGLKIRGILLAADNDSIKIEEIIKPQKGKNNTESKFLTISIKNIKSAKPVLCF